MKNQGPTVGLSLKGKTWQVRYKPPGSTNRIKRSTKTQDKDLAEIIQKQIQCILIDPEFDLIPAAYEVFFGEMPDAGSVEGAHELKKYDDEESLAYVIASQADEIVRLKKEKSELLKQLKEVDFWKNKYNAVTSTIEGRMIEQQDSLPTLEEALKRYESSINHLARYRRNYIIFIEDLFKQIGLDKKLNEVHALQIDDWLEKDLKNFTGKEFPEKRWMRQRQKFTKFFNWACGKWTFINPTDYVSKKKVPNENDIEWHDIKTAMRTIHKQKSLYDKTMLSVLFFTGMSAHEFRGLRKEDFFKIDDTYYLRVTPNECRDIKTHKRRRNIPINCWLKKKINKYLEEQPDGVAFFPPLLSKDNRPFWHEETLSRYLTKTVFEVYNTPNFNNENFIKMDCKSTRRSFGSWMLRSGKTVADVAALMGNSIKMVETHYARIIAEELNTDIQIKRAK